MIRPRNQDLCAILIGSILTALFAEPTDISILAGIPVAAAGVLLWFLAAMAHPLGSAADVYAWDRGGIYSHVRHPRITAAFLLVAGVLLTCASSGKYGRWVGRSACPLAVLYFFIEALPRADAELRRAADAAGDRARNYFTKVPAFLPLLFKNPWPVSVNYNWRRLASPREWFWIVYLSLLIYFCVWRARNTDWLRW
ncbi:MAG: hypothetical protein ACKVS6_17050 [Planctomycetota bacterium]